MRQKDYTRLGGWMMFFIIISGYAVLANLATGAQMLSYGYILLGVLIFAVVALRVVMVVQLFRRDESARYWLIAEGVVGVVTNFYTAYLTNWDARTLALAVGSIVSYGLWVLYFYRSRRVAAYMHPERYAPAMQQPYEPDSGYGVPAQPLQQPQQTAFCPACGKPTTPGASFCGSCGSQLPQ